MARRAGSFQRIDGVDVLVHRTRPAGEVPQSVISKRPWVDETARPEPIRPNPALKSKRRRRVADIALTDEV